MRRLRRPLGDVEDDAIDGVDAAGDDGYGDACDRLLFGWMFVAVLLDKLRDGQVHVAVDGYQTLYSLLLLHCHNPLLLPLLLVAPPKLLTMR